MITESLEISATKTKLKKHKPNKMLFQRFFLRTNDLINTLKCLLYLVETSNYRAEVLNRK